jgi:plastocyanin
MSGARRAIFVAGLAFIALVLAQAAPVLAADQSVSIAGFAFQPGTVTVRVGDSVTWTNNDQVAHTADADNGSWGTGNIAAGASATLTFNSAGTYPYHCEIHPQMTGRVVVQAAAGGGGPGPTDPATDTEPVNGSGSSPADIVVIALASAAVSLLFLGRIRPSESR